MKWKPGYKKIPVLLWQEIFLKVQNKKKMLNNKNVIFLTEIYFRLKWIEISRFQNQNLMHGQMPQHGLVMSSIAGMDTWYRYHYRYLGIERGIDTKNRYREEVSKSIDSWTGIQIRYRKVSIPGKGIKIGYRKVSIPKFFFNTSYFSS